MEGSPLAKDILMRPSRAGWNKKKLNRHFYYKNEKVSLRLSKYM